ncbi:MAG: alanine racemase [Ruminococcaceae bacterium]|nr:alanine racemase [Oscillospiraceae bacterium]
MSDGGYRLYSSLEDIGVSQKLARIDLCALRENYRILRKSLSQRKPDLRLICVVKADAYGHGARACVHALLDEGCTFFAVSCIEEAIAVRASCDEKGADAEILILGYTDPSLAYLLGRHGLTQTLLSAEYARRLDKAAEAAGVRLLTHVAINTGMNRIGFDARTDEECAISAHAIERVCALPSLDVRGMFTHYARADETEESGKAATRLQTARYSALLRALEERGVRIPLHHTCNSAAALGGEAELFDGVRLGIVLYGAARFLHAGLNLRPVMRLEAKILHTYTLIPGECVGYGGTFDAETEREIAVIGIGYADGWLRAYRGAKLLLKTRDGVHYVPMVGNVCMDQCMLDVTGTGARVGDTVTLFGGESADQLSSLSSRAGSIDYEALCLISSRVLRVYNDFEK